LKSQAIFFLCYDILRRSSSPLSHPLCMALSDWLADRLPCQSP